MHIASAIRNKTDPETLDSIERYTLGVVNPELLWYFVDTMTPLILFSNFEQPFRFKELDATEGANYSVQEVAKLLDVPEFKVEGWVKAGLKASENKISGKDLDEFLMNHGHHRGFYLVNPEQNYSIQDLSKRLHVSDRTITELWLTSGLKITADGNILGRNLVDFLTARAADNKNPVFGLYDNDLFITESVACDYENFSEEDKRRVSLKSFYVETCISYYVASCVGRTLGAAITRKFQGPILNFLSYTGDKFLDGLAKLHIIGKDTREICTGVKEEFIDGIDESIMVLKMVLKEGLAPQSPIREMIVARLGKRGTISANQDSSVDDQNKELLRLVLKHCRLKHLITHLDAANIMQYFLTKKQIDDELIDKIVTALRNNLLASVGGWIGELAANGGVNLLTNWKGPMQLYPSKLMKYVNA